MLELTPDSLTPNIHGKAAYNEAITNFLGNYVWRSIHALMDHQDFNASPIWIANKLGLSVEEAAEALDGLVLLGLAERTAKGFEPKKVQFLIPEEEMQIDTRMHKHTLLSQQILNRFEPTTRTNFYAHFSASNKQLFREMYSKIVDAINEFEQKSMQQPKDGVYGLSFTGLNIMTDNNKGGAQ